MYLSFWYYNQTKLRYGSFSVIHQNSPPILELRSEKSVYYRVIAVLAVLLCVILYFYFSVYFKKYSKHVTWRWYKVQNYYYL